MCLCAHVRAAESTGTVRSGLDSEILAGRSLEGFPCISQCGRNVTDIERLHKGTGRSKPRNPFESCGRTACSFFKTSSEETEKE